MGRKIAFIQKGTIPLASKYVAQVLQDNFPEFEVETIDIKKLLSRRIDIKLINALYTFKEYGADISAKTKKAKTAFFRTTYLFRKIKLLMARKLDDPAV